MFTSITVFTHVLLLAPLAAKAASFTGCMSASTIHRAQDGIQLVAYQGADCIDQCTAQGFDYSYSYYWDADQLQYCHCGSEEELVAKKESLHSSYEGERCFEDDATIHHSPTDYRYAHSIDYLLIDNLPAEGKKVSTPGQCFDLCSSSESDRVYILPPHNGASAEDHLYQCLCDGPESTLDIQEEGISGFADASSYRRFDTPSIGYHRLVFQSFDQNLIM